MKANVTKRPGRPKSAEKARAIKQAAVNLFMADGIDRTSMDAIAAAAGVSKQTVYSHFKSKDDLFRSCVAGKLSAYGLDASQLPHDDDFDTVLLRIGKHYMELLADKGVVCMFRLMAAEANTHPKVVRSFHESGPIATAHNVAGIFSRHLPGAPDNEELARVATSEFLALVRGEYFLELILGTRTGIDAGELDAHVRHCIGQIRKLYEIC